MSKSTQKCPRCGGGTRIIYHNGDDSLLQCDGCGKHFGQQNARIAELEKFIEGILGTMQESTGIVGYHLNGDIATWDELGLIEEATELLKGKDHE